jgi:hypothetical protein
MIMGLHDDESTEEKHARREYSFRHLPSLLIDTDLDAT